MPVEAHRPRPWGPGDSPRTALAALLQTTDRFAVDASRTDVRGTESNGGRYRRHREDICRCAAMPGINRKKAMKTKRRKTADRSDKNKDELLISVCLIVNTSSSAFGA